MTVSEDVQTLNPGSLLELFKIDATELGAGTSRFHAHGVDPIIWQGETYYPWPIEATGFGLTADQQPRPKLKVANLDGSISLLCLMFDDLVGAEITRHRTFKHYLDAENWPDTDIETLTSGGASGDWTFFAIDGYAQRNGASAGSCAFACSPLTAGHTYRFRFNVADFSGDTISVLVGAVENAYEITGNGEQYFDYAPIADGYIQIKLEPAAGIPGEATISNFRVIASPGAGNPTADPTQEFPPELWFIERKALETREQVEFELATALDFGDVNLPRRQIIANQCDYEYRGEYCNYSGAAVAKIDDTPTSDLGEDRCGKKLFSCGLREWPDGVLNFGGYPAAGLVRS